MMGGFSDLMDYPNSRGKKVATSVRGVLDKLESRTVALQLQLRSGELAATNFNAKYEKAVVDAEKAILDWHKAELERVIGDDISPIDPGITFPKGMPASDQIMICDAVNNKLSDQRKRAGK